MNKGRVFRYVSNISFGIGAVLSVVALILIISSRTRLPANVCPTETYLPLIIPALVLLILSFLTSFFAEKKTKRQPDTKQ